ncbi:ankyrin repeat domain-containing protein [Pusillimonas sp. DMV24BSW_D]|uniref:ankyrin repeat domain-containing protein n=1 Tax=Neopusillimonas aestuarii TaxID=2716226 RepID=UPI001409C3A4|nr:ankyrin repeat domain-containing protein [Pusillimonas sp. DMV24BSW_D]QIM49634.1 ankyrin repeat domain-containing protein [Pusillimonas sp. DMV24BSW_D]
MSKINRPHHFRFLTSLALAGVLLTGTVVNAASANWWIDIANDRVEAVKTELALGEDPNVRNEKGQPAIMQAIQDQAWGVYDLLARHRDLNPNIANTYDETPLMYLAIVGDVERARALIKRGAKVNRLGWTPLHYAASKGHIEMVNMLIQAGAIVDAPAPDGTTPLMMAAYSGDQETVRAVLAAGAEPTTQNLQKLDAADWARNKEFTSLADQLEDLIQRTLAQRGSGRARSAVPGIVGTTPPSKVPSAPSAAKATLEPSSTQAETGSSTSRYFDLDRFERDDNQF